MGFAARRDGGFVLLMVVVTLLLLTTVALWLGRESSVALNLSGAQQQRSAVSYAALAALEHAGWQANRSACDNYADIVNQPLGSMTYSASLQPDNGSPVEITASGEAADGSRVELVRWRSVFDGQSTVPFSAAADTSIDESEPNNNNGADLQLLLSNTGAAQQRALLQFDLSPLPAAAHVVSASLQLHFEGMASSSSVDVSVQALSRQWDEAYASWNRASVDELWEAPGGDTEAKTYATASIEPLSPGAVQWDVSELLRRWIEQGQNNAGLMLLVEAGGDTLQFSSREHSVLAQRPRLTLKYRCECGQVCVALPACNGDYQASFQAANTDVSALGMSKPAGVAFAPMGSVIGGVTVSADGAQLLVDESLRKVFLVSHEGDLLAELPISSTSAPAGISWVAGGQWRGHMAIADRSGSRIYLYDGNGNLQSSLSTLGLIVAPRGIATIDRSASGTFDEHWVLVSDKGLLGLPSPNAQIFTQGMLSVRSISLSGIADKPYGVAHIPGTDKLLISDADQGRVVVVDFNGNLLSSYDTSALGATVPEGVAMNGVNCQHMVAGTANDVVLALQENADVSCDTAYADVFASASFSGSDGSVDWSGSPWQELGESDGVAAGSVQVKQQGGEGWLSIRGADNGVEREMDLSGAGQGFLSLQYQRVQLDDAADAVTVEVSANGTVGPWVQLQRFEGAADDSGFVSELFDLGDYLSANTRIRLKSSTGMGADDRVLFDDVRVDSCGS